MVELSKELLFVHDRPIPKDTFMFFKDKHGPRVFLTITDDPSVWRRDLAITERFFSEMIVCPFVTTVEECQTQIETTKEILKQRSKYPGVKDDPEALLVSKTWVLPTKIWCGPSAKSFLTPGVQSIQTALEPICTQLKTESAVHVLKLEIPNGMERQILYTFLDSGLRPSLLIVKWSFDLDDHIPTAHCAGHLMNSGYALISHTNEYSLYLYNDESLYDICSMKTVGLQNPILTSLTESMNETIKGAGSSPRPVQEEVTEN